ncbi:MAG: hypothetical protein M3P82_01585 [Bacteroidota bacterium]|nr:hypothetical protein [Bacteroidota bacterium]
MYGSSGIVESDVSLSELLEKFNYVYLLLESEVLKQLDTLNSTQIKDEFLKDVLKTELHFYIHMLTTHIAMHCDALLKMEALCRSEKHMIKELGNSGYG